MIPLVEVSVFWALQETPCRITPTLRCFLKQRESCLPGLLPAPGALGRLSQASCCPLVLLQEQSKTHTLQTPNPPSRVPPPQPGQVTGKPSSPLQGAGSECLRPRTLAPPHQLAKPSQPQTSPSAPEPGFPHHAAQRLKVNAQQNRGLQTLAQSCRVRAKSAVNQSHNAIARK